MSDVEIAEEIEVSKKCFRYQERLFGNLNITYNESNSTYVLWNKYQIFIHEEENFDNATRVLTPEFQIRRLIPASNYIICLDNSGNIHINSLKFKNTSQKRFKSSFLPREQGVLQCTKYSSYYILSLKEDAQTYFLCLNRISSDFQKETNILLNLNEDWPLHSKDEKIIINSYEISKKVFTHFKNKFNIEDAWKNHCLVLISFDMLTVYACLISHKDPNEICDVVKLYTSPTEICDVAIIEKENLKLIIGLTTGTIIEILLDKFDESTELNTIHLNTALSKFLSIKSNDVLIYTDGVTMWKTEDTFSSQNITFQKIFVKDVKDFIKCGDQIICTTFSNLIYIFCIEEESSYVSCDGDLCPVDKVLNNSAYLFKINEEIERNKGVVLKVEEEEKHLMALSLSKRCDLMEDVIHQEIKVFDSYEDVIKESTEIIHAETFEKYFKPNSIMFLVKLTTSPIDHILSNIIYNILKHLEILIIFILQGKVLKTVSIFLPDQLRKLNILIPLKNEDITQLNVEIKLVYKIPGVLDKRKETWTCLYNKNVKLNAEHFITIKSVKNDIYLKEPVKPIQDLILNIAQNQHGDLFNIAENKLKINRNSLTFYVKLPNNFKEILSDMKTFAKHFNLAKSTAIQTLVTDEFLKSKENLVFEIGTRKVQLFILNDDFFSPALKVSSENGQIALDVWNFFSNLLNELEDCAPGNEFVSNSLYTTTENIRKAMKNAIDGTNDEILSLAEQFHLKVIGILPI